MNSLGSGKSCRQTYCAVKVNCKEGFSQGLLLAHSLWNIKNMECSKAKMEHFKCDFKKIYMLNEKCDKVFYE